MPTREAKATLPTSRQSQNCRRRREETLELSLPSIPRGPQPTSQARASSPRRPQLQIVGDDVGRLSHRHRRPPRPFATTTQASRSLIFSPTPQELYGPPAVVRLISSPGGGFLRFHGQRLDFRSTPLLGSRPSRGGPSRAKGSGNEPGFGTAGSYPPRQSLL